MDTARGGRPSLSHQRGRWESKEAQEMKSGWSHSSCLSSGGSWVPIEKGWCLGKPLSLSLFSCATGHLALYQRVPGICDWMYRAPWLGELPSHSCPGLGNLRKVIEGSTASVFWRRVHCMWCSWNWQDICQTENQLRYLLKTWGDSSILFMVRNCPRTRYEQWNCSHGHWDVALVLDLHQLSNTAVRRGTCGSFYRIHSSVLHP